MVDPQTAITVSVGNRVVQWDLSTQKSKPIFSDQNAKTIFVDSTTYLYPPNESGVGNRTPPTGVVVSADTTLAVTYGEDVVVWRLDGSTHAEAQAFRIDVAWPVRDAATFVAGGEEYVVCVGQTIGIWSLRDGTCQTRVVGSPEGYGSVAVSHDAKWVFCGTGDGQIERWSFEELMSSDSGLRHISRVWHLLWLNDRECCSGGSDAQAILWRDGLPITSLLHDENFVSPYCAMGDRVVVGANSAPIKLWDTGSDDYVDLDLENLHGSYMVAAAVLLPDDELLVAGVNQRLVIWQLKNLEAPVLEFFDGPWPHVIELVLSNTRERALTVASPSGKLQVWDIAQRCLLWEHRPSWSSDETYSGNLISLGEDQFLCHPAKESMATIVDVQACEEVGSITMPQGETFADPLKPGGLMTFESNEDDTGAVHRIDPRSGATLERFPSPIGSMDSWIVEGTIAVGCGARVAAFDLKSLEVVLDHALEEQVFCHALSPDRSTLAIGLRTGAVEFVQLRSS